MNLLRLSATLLLTAASALSAQAATYNYTGNEFAFDGINPTNSRVLASFTFNVADDYSGSLDGFRGSHTNQITWSGSAGALELSSSASNYLNRYYFQIENGIVKAWYFSMSNDLGEIMSLSANHVRYAPNEAIDRATVWASGVKGAVLIGDQGTWTTSPVPEPASYLMFGAGLAVLLAARRKQKQSIATQ
ncbi:PEP-CTERM sorting domain-containing protein [Massilia rubra]|uniref:PEP-CTERM sorting domain-containing protein n=1 Tax=Massilia rubra TaxID=2607910 RepID=A0ABX0LQA8_9BURK|nr:PEP-CTERM sorting domain-containing protein [Massilia rubra]NHZ36929.1 PEP-CTERM sorting domain-containing protein [Massilia rubra]